MEQIPDIKETIKQRYGAIATTDEIPSSCCSSSCGESPLLNIVMAEDYHKEDVAGVEIANLNLGCGTPTDYADLREGMTVLDLGSGAGIDVFIASKYVGATGNVIGVDMTEAMIARAKKNAIQLGIPNVDFRFGEIEQMPVDSNSVDRIISNCVLNLVPNKQRAFSEMYRVLKPGGAFAVSDIVVTGSMPENVQRDAELWAGCIAGAIKKEEYLSLLRETGFRNVSVLKEKKYAEVSSNEYALLSITVKGEK
ncbi:MAG: arsenite methyltransferase [Ignavibacteriales bacterium]|nr:arsenite methyltransferase [Ignavibacteriales bacterium]